MSFFDFLVLFSTYFDSLLYKPILYFYCYTHPKFSEQIVMAFVVLIGMCKLGRIWT